MELQNLKTAVEKIKMTDDAKQSIVRNCQTETVRERHNAGHNRNRFRKPVKLAAALAVCFCFAGTMANADQAGFFQDIHNLAGAITGTSYEQASEEIEVCVEYTQGSDVLYVSAVFLKPDVAPYRELDTVSILEYEILDASGKLIAKGKGTEPAVVQNGGAVMEIPVAHIKPGDYVLEISSFTGEKKADQPLQINGFWMCEFTV